MLSYHNSIELKDSVVVRAKSHVMCGNLLSGSYGSIEGGRFRGCSVGCDVYDYLGGVSEGLGLHVIVSRYLGIPVWMEVMRDVLFEGMGYEAGIKFHVSYKESIVVGVDLGCVRNLLSISRMECLIGMYGSSEYVVGILGLVIEYHRLQLRELGSGKGLREQIKHCVRNHRGICIGQGYAIGCGIASMGDRDDGMGRSLGQYVLAGMCIGLSSRDIYVGDGNCLLGILGDM